MKNNNSSSRREKRRTWLLPVLVLVAAFGFLGVYLLEKQEDRIRTSDLQDAPVERLQLFYNGKNHLYSDDLTTYLIMGTDETTDSAFQYEGKNVNNKQADFIMLMIVDRTDQSYTALHLNRDTLMDIRCLNNDGNPDGYVTAHLNNAHSFGSGSRDSCRNVAEAVSRLLYGIPVDHYLAVTMDGIPVLADLADGVPVHLEEDLTALNPAYVKGADVMLKGGAALRYVRSRTNVSDGTNLSRMQRQRGFVRSLYERLNSKLGSDAGFALEFADTLSPYITSDMITDELAKLAEQLQEYRFGDIEDTAGQSVVNKETGYTEYHVDMDALKEQVVRLFFTQ